METKNIVEEEGSDDVEWWDDTDLVSGFVCKR